MLTTDHIKSLLEKLILTFFNDISVNHHLIEKLNNSLHMKVSCQVLTCRDHSMLVILFLRITVIALLIVGDASFGECLLLVILVMCDGVLADVQGVGEEVQLPLVHLKLLPPGLLLPCHNSDLRDYHEYIQTQVCGEQIFTRQTKA